MLFDYSVLDNSEKISFALRKLCMDRGYTRYRMSKFEEYDLYSRNKDFLTSAGIITFTDTDGRLMALKPDVTLSIIKNQTDEPDQLKKLCYDENVYRVTGGSGGFREILQSGVECIGSVDRSCVASVLSLGARSLDIFGRSFVLEISQLDILWAFIEDIIPGGESAERLLALVGEKNIHEMLELCHRSGVSEEKAQALADLMKIKGKPEAVWPQLEKLCRGKALEELDNFRRTLELVEPEFREMLCIDFSLVADMNYYNGIVFKGFIRGIPESVLSGGQYDSLMKKMKKKSSGIGFAVYLEALEGLAEGEA